MKNYKENLYTNDIDILDSEGNIVCTIVYRPEKPLSCGATIWIETHNQIKIK